MKSNELQKIYLELLNNNLFIISDINIQVNISNHAVYLINKKVWNSLKLGNLTIIPEEFSKATGNLKDKTAE